MQDVADAAGLSRATVSKYFNVDSTLKKSTKEKIERVSQSLHYIPDPNAISLVTGRSNLIGIITPYINEPFFSMVLYFMEREATKHSLQIVIQNSNNDPQKEAAVMHAFPGLQAQIIASDIEAAESSTWAFEAYGQHQLLHWLAQDKKLGLEPGKDVLVTGHDDVEFASYLQPSLTTVRQDVEGIGSAAIQWLSENQHKFLLLD
ncbi:hypothetical protein ACTFIZ_007989 [Dictyostelium cf. discoideum]